MAEVERGQEQLVEKVAERIRYALQGQTLGPVEWLAEDVIVAVREHDRSAGGQERPGEQEWTITVCSKCGDHTEGHGCPRCGSWGSRGEYAGPESKRVRVVPAPEETE